MHEWKPGTIATYTGRFVDPLNMKLEDFYLPDIAHALALKPRYSGHCRWHYSIAQHCCLAAQFTPTNREVALLHDAAEAYLFDIPRPLKDRKEFEFYNFAELRVLDLILERYLPNLIRGSWDMIDRQLLINECRALMTNWSQFPAANEFSSIFIPIEPWAWQVAEQNFLALAAVLGIKD